MGLYDDIKKGLEEAIDYNRKQHGHDANLVC